MLVLQSYLNMLYSANYFEIKHFDAIWDTLMYTLCNRNIKTKLVLPWRTKDKDFKKRKSKKNINKLWEK